MKYVDIEIPFGCLLTTTVRVDDETKKKLKRLAAALDATQSDVIGRALRLYEGQVMGARLRRKISRRVLEALRAASSKISQSDPKWARVSRTIESSSVSVEEFVAASWGKEL